MQGKEVSRFREILILPLRVGKTEGKKGGEKVFLESSGKRHALPVCIIIMLVCSPCRKHPVPAEVFFTKVRGGEILNRT